MVQPKKSSLKSQQLLIPKGLLSANEVAVVEIPKRYRRMPVIVAKKDFFRSRRNRNDDDMFINSPQNVPQQPIMSNQFQQNRASYAPSQGYDNYPSSSQQESMRAPSGRILLLNVAPEESSQSYEVTMPNVGNRRQMVAVYSELELQVPVQNTLPFLNQMPLDLSRNYDLSQGHACVLRNPTCPVLASPPQFNASCVTNMQPQLNAACIASLQQQQLNASYLTNSMQQPQLNTSYLTNNMQQTQPYWTRADLQERERLEKDLVRSSLEEFQEARRNFLEQANSLAGQLKRKNNKYNNDSSSDEE